MRTLIVAALASTLAVSGANATTPQYTKDSDGNYLIPQFEIDRTCSQFGHWARECVKRNQDGYYISEILWQNLSNESRHECIYISWSNGWTLPYEALAKCVISYSQKEDQQKPAQKFVR